MADVLAIIAPVLLCAGVGFAWVRAGRSYDRALFARLISDLGAPCLVFSSLVELRVPPEDLARISGAALLAIVSFAVVAYPILRLARLPAHTFLNPILFANAGNMGMPLCLFAFGAPGLTLAATYYATSTLAHFTAGIWIWSGRVSLAELLRTPLSWAALLAVAVLATDLTLPRWLLNTVELLGQLTIPLMLLTLGASLSELELQRVPRTLLLSLLRLGLGLAVGATLAHLLGFEGALRGVLILEAAMPVAVFNYLLAERYGRSPEAVASLVVLSTVLAFALLPFLLRFALEG